MCDHAHTDARGAHRGTTARKAARARGERGARARKRSVGLLGPINIRMATAEQLQALLAAAEYVSYALLACWLLYIIRSLVRAKPAKKRRQPPSNDAVAPPPLSQPSLNIKAQSGCGLSSAGNAGPYASAASRAASLDGGARAR